MRGNRIDIAGATLEARASGALHWPDERVLVVGDLHLGRSERLARSGAPLLPPYETADTLDRLEAEVAALRPRTVVCLGDSFDDLAAANGVASEVGDRIVRLAAGRRWIWVTGNHDPGPVDMAGEGAASVRIGPLVLRHIAGAVGPGEGEVSAHFHPKARLCLRGVRISRRCFLAGPDRVILPAFGTYTGGLDVADKAFRPLMGPGARAILIGSRMASVPLERLAP